MDFDKAYQQAVESEYREGVGFFGPQNTLDEMNTVNIAVQQLNGVVSSPSSKVRQEVKDSWNLFKDGWDRFYDSHNSTINPLDYISRSLNETMDKVLEYRKKTVEWQKALAKEGVQQAGPKLEPGSSEFPWQLALIAGGLLLGYVLVKEVGKGVGSAVSTVSKKIAE
jgi:hypothetical protein